LGTEASKLVLLDLIPKAALSVSLKFREFSWNQRCSTTFKSNREKQLSYRLI
jgi:hypothetical protein